MNSVIRTPKQLGHALREARVRTKLTQTEVALVSGLRQATISEIEAGEGATKVSTLCTLLAALNLELNLVPRNSDASQDIEDLF
ncbi:helix-turn-helix domain-containing protein [Phenylobacterium sp.]|uniref:helix-turn-helix domain-containing protein n=1 Tax=Phenylobacterium sp. TaxID=1871053 RepID=UPI0030F3FBAE